MAFDRKQFEYGLLVGSGLTILVAFVVFLIWKFFYPAGSDFPVSLVTFGSAGLIFTIAGCIGPGRYRKIYDIILYYPRSGSSYYNKVVISAFARDPSLKKALLLANGVPIEEIEFENGVFEKEYTIKDFKNQTVIELQLSSLDGKIRSNKNAFTFYDIMDFSDEELLEIENNPIQVRRLTVEQGRDEYIKSLETNIVWFSIGLFLVGIFVGLSIAFL